MKSKSLSFGHLVSALLASTALSCGSGQKLTGGYEESARIATSRFLRG